MSTNKKKTPKPRDDGTITQQKFKFPSYGDGRHLAVLF